MIKALSSDIALMMEQCVTTYLSVWGMYAYKETLTKRKKIFFDKKVLKNFTNYRCDLS